MFLSKLKNAIAMTTVALILTAGAGAWRYAAEAGQAEDKLTPLAEPVRPVTVPKWEEPKRPMTLPRDRQFQIDLRIEREKDGQRLSLAEPRLMTLEDRPATFAMGKNAPPINIGRGQMEVKILGTEVKVVVRTEDRSKVRLDITVTRSGPIRISQEVDIKTTSFRFLRTAELGQPITVNVAGEKDSLPLHVTAAVQEVVEDSKPSAKAAAEKDYQVAEFYRRTGHPDSARFYYELICRRYPNTTCDERAKKRLAQLKEKLPARVGQIFIIGNEKTLDSDILEQLPFYPGQILNYPDLRTAEQNLSRLTGLKSKPKVTVIDQEGKSEFKDIEITVEEK
jgi:hypothetical protein